MQFQLLLAAFIGLVAAQGSVCFDDGDCLLSGGKCVKKPGQLILGYVSSIAINSWTYTDTSLTSNCQSKTTTMTTSVVSGAPAKATGSVCFDDGDCILSGGKCKKAAGQLILGYVTILRT
jgi:hypothetical protein